MTQPARLAPALASATPASLPLEGSKEASYARHAQSAPTSRMKCVADAALHARSAAMHRTINQASSAPSASETTKSRTLASVYQLTVVRETFSMKVHQRGAKTVASTARPAVMRTTVWTACRGTGSSRN